MALVTAGELQRWGKTTTARDKLGELLSKLIHNAIPLQNIRRIRFLADEANQLAGWDGLIECDSNITWIPSGTSAWELGTGSNGRDKIKSDYGKRLKKELPSTWHRNSTIYIAVTLNKLDNLTELENELKSNSPWKDVKVYDAQTIAEWVQQFLYVQTWLQEHKVGPPPTIQTLQMKWQNWSEGTNPTGSTGLILVDREESAKQLLDALKTGGLINVKGDSPDEVIAFVFAALDKSEKDFRSHYQARSVVVTNTDDADNLRNFPPHVVILRPPATEKAQMLVRYGHTVINALGNSSLSQKADLNLIRPLRSNFSKVLIEMGLAEEQAKTEARACGSSPAVWRVWNNLRQGDVPSDIPNWAKPENAKLVVPAVLLGGWSEKFVGDKNVIKTITGQKFKNYRDNLQQFLSHDNPLLTKIDDAWLVTAPATAFALIINHITTGNLEKLSDIASEVFSEIDPTIDLDPDERPFASVHKVGLKHSTWLRDGLAETLLRIVVLGDRLESEGKIPKNQTCQDFVDQLIRNLPGLNKDWRLLASLRDQLPVLAEAAPNPLLEALEHLLQGDPKKILPIFAEGESGFSSHSFHSSFLWALETLAWDSRYLARVGLILAKLAKIDPGGRLVNRPINSLRGILLAWLPGTSANLDQRVELLDLIFEREPEVGWSLLSSLLPRPHQIAHPTHKPIWRDFGRSQIEKFTRKEVWITYQKYIEQALLQAGNKPLRWKELIDVYPDVSEAHQQAIEEGLKKLAKTTLDDNSRKEMWDKLRRFVSRHREFPDAKWALPDNRLKRLDEIRDLYLPQDDLSQISWLFNEHFPDIPFPKRDFKQLETQIKKLRNEACEKLLKKSGINALLTLIDMVKLPGMVSEPLVEFLHDENEILSVFEKTNQGSENQRIFARNLSKNAYDFFGDQWTNLILSKAKKLSWSVDGIVNAFVYYPDSTETFNLVNSLGIDIENHYWKVRYGSIHAADNDALMIAIEKLKSVGRVLDVIALGPERLSTLDSNQIFELLYLAIQELNESKKPQVLGDIGYRIEELFNWLRKQNDIDRTSLAKLEYAYLPLLTGHYGKKDLALHELLAADAEFFVDVICDVYKPTSGEDETEQLSEQKQLKAEFGWDLLNSWQLPPGIKENNQVDGVKLKDWVYQVRNLASEKDRIDITDEYIGKILYHYPDDPSDNAWPHIELRKLLEALQNEKIELGIEIEDFNSRGVTSRGVFEGGAQERELAQKWRSWAEILSSRWPRTRAMLERIADSWEHHAKQEDIRAEKNRHRFS